MDDECDNVNMTAMSSLKLAQKLNSMDILVPETLGDEMKGILTDYYITASRIANAWNEESYKTVRETEWCADKVVKKFKNILENMKKFVPDKEKILEKLYRSENSGREDSDFIFFDASEMIKHNRKLENASLSERMSSDDWPDARNYETEAYGSLKCIFKLWDEANGVEHLTSSEFEIFIKKMENLLPQFRNIDMETTAVDDAKCNKFELLKEMNAQYEEDKLRIREYLRQVYIESRGGELYRRRIYIEESPIENGQIDLLIEWVKKWTYVIDHMVQVYTAADNVNLDVHNVVKVLLIWYQNEKRERIVLEKELCKELSDEINEYLSRYASRVKEALSRKVKEILDKYSDEYAIEALSLKSGEGVGKSRFGSDQEEMDLPPETVKEIGMKYVSRLAKYRKEDFEGEIIEHYRFVKEQAFKELEEIHETVYENVELLRNSKKEGRKGDVKREKIQSTDNILFYMQSCLDEIVPHVDRISMIPKEEET